MSRAGDGALRLRGIHFWQHQGRLLRSRVTQQVEKDDKGRITRSWSGTFSRGQDGSFHHRGEMDDRWDMLEKSAQDIWKSLVEDEEKRLRDMLSDLTSR